jgi:hypothetical protein
MKNAASRALTRLHGVIAQEIENLIPDLYVLSPQDVR